MADDEEELDIQVEDVRGSLPLSGGIASLMG